MLGKIMRIQCAATGQTVTNIAKERTAELTITAQSLGSAVNRRGTKKITQKKSWSITGDMIFTPSEFLRLFRFLMYGTKVDVTFANFEGAAYVTDITLNARVGSVASCKVKMQGTGALLDVS
jgi:hypothetical protein